MWKYEGHLLFYFIICKKDVVINKCLLLSWKGSKKKVTVITQETQPSQNPGSKEDDKKKHKDSTPKQPTKEKEMKIVVMKMKVNLSLMIMLHVLST